MDIINNSLFSWFLAGVTRSTTVLGAWILATGFWSDSGSWDDNDVWND